MNFPASRRFRYSDIPTPSCHKILTRLPHDVHESKIFHPHAGCARAPPGLATPACSCPAACPSVTAGRNPNFHAGRKRDHARSTIWMSRARTFASVVVEVTSRRPCRPPGPAHRPQQARAQVQASRQPARNASDPRQRPTAPPVPPPTPPRQKRAGDFETPRRGCRPSRCRVALFDNPKLLRVRPTTPPPGIRDRKNLNLGHDAMVCHSFRLLQAAGPVRQTAFGGALRPTRCASGLRPAP